MLVRVGQGICAGIFSAIVPLLIKETAPFELLGVFGVFQQLFIVIGIFVGAMAGYYGGWIDNILMRLTEFFQVLPALLFAMVIVALFSPSLRTISLAIGLVSWPGMARLTRAEFLKIKNLEYVQAERAMGSNDTEIIWKVILPNALPPLIVNATFPVF